jgi:hypothetical protein
VLGHDWLVVTGGRLPDCVSAPPWDVVASAPETVAAFDDDDVDAVPLPNAPTAAHAPRNTTAAPVATARRIRRMRTRGLGGASDMGCRIGPVPQRFLHTA